MTTQQRLQKASEIMSTAFAEAHAVLKQDKLLDMLSMKFGIYAEKNNMYLGNMFGVHSMTNTKATVAVDYVKPIEKEKEIVMSSEPTEAEIAEFNEQVTKAIADIAKVNGKGIAAKVIEKYETIVFDGVVKKLGLSLSAPYDYFKLMDMRAEINKMVGNKS